MTDKKRDERTFEMELDLRHPPETVWQALTDARELTRWFPARAEVEPRVGGRVLFARDMPGCAFDTRVDRWEPNQRLRLLEPKEHDGAPVELAMDFQLTARKGGTSLRLVHSGFGRGADWDDEFAGISRGWAYELRMLRRYLDAHRGQDRHMAMFSHPTHRPGREAFDILFGPKGLAREGELFGIGEGAAYAMTDVAGVRRRGEVLAANPPIEWAGTVEGEDPGVLRFHVEGGLAMLGLALWGNERARDQVDRFQRDWSRRLSELLG